MYSQLYSLVYCSRNRIDGDPAHVKRELQAILASSRRNNPRHNVTGALLYNAGCFAQILEGPLASVERIFETIQQDPRHSEVVVIQSGPIPERQFPEWSMAFAGSASMDEIPVATAAFEAVFRQGEGASEQVLALLKALVVEEGEWVLVDTPVA